ncbi:hypothetical protein HOK021_45890 [Streptomyces hygroscopicus]|nr:Tn3 family transposase [Streptomyces hygroscopicus]BDH13410.1 hypothetical protein HOK021_45890 [Streptomyces hygroscopicus]
MTTRFNRASRALPPRRPTTSASSAHSAWSSRPSCSGRRRYIDAAVTQLRAEGHEIRAEGITRLSPLKHRNLNLVGRYSFSVPAAGRPAPAARPGYARAHDDEGEDEADEDEAD